MDDKSYGYWVNNPDQQVVLIGHKYHRDFIYHRENGPAWIDYYPDGTVESESWYVHGYLHNTEGPGHIKYHPNGTVAIIQFWYYSCIPEHIPYKHFSDEGILIEEEYTFFITEQNFFPYREDGAAKTFFDPETGQATYKEYSYHKEGYDHELDSTCFMYDNNKIYKRKTYQKQFKELYPHLQDHRFYKVEIFDIDQNIVDIEYEMLISCYEMSMSESDEVNKVVFQNIEELQNYFILS